MSIITYDDNLFRAQFPEFKDQEKYPEPLIHGYWDMATNYVSVENFALLTASSLPLAVNQCTAHLMTLASNSSSGQQGGFVTVATIDKISTSVLPPQAQDQFSWWLNQTPYGQQLAALLEISGVGGFYIGGLNERGSFRKAGGGFN